MPKEKEYRDETPQNKYEARRDEKIIEDISSYNYGIILRCKFVNEARDETRPVWARPVGGGKAAPISLADETRITF